MSVKLCLAPVATQWLTKGQDFVERYYIILNLLNVTITIRANLLDCVVIGYYEGWSARSNCHRTLPTDLPSTAFL